LITGAGGFIGRQALSPLLEKNYEVHAVSRTPPSADLLFDGVIWHQADLLKPQEVAELTEKIKFTHLLHFA